MRHMHGAQNTVEKHQKNQKQKSKKTGETGKEKKKKPWAICPSNR